MENDLALGNRVREEGRRSSSVSHLLSVQRAEPGTGAIIHGLG